MRGSHSTCVTLRRWQCSTLWSPSDAIAKLSKGGRASSSNRAASSSSFVLSPANPSFLPHPLGVDGLRRGRRVPDQDLAVLQTATYEVGPFLLIAKASTEYGLSNTSSGVIRSAKSQYKTWDDEENPSTIVSAPRRSRYFWSDGHHAFT